MSAAALLVDLAAHGVTLQPDGERLRFHPRDAVTPELLERIKAHKAELLAMLRLAPEAPAVDLADATQVWQAALSLLSDDPLFPPELLEALGSTKVRFA